MLDPACGSGNFLYVTLQKLKDLEKEVIVHGLDCGFTGYLPLVGPWQLHGIELNRFAYDLAQTAVWIGHLQWTRANGFHVAQNPVLRPMDKNFHNMDAILVRRPGQASSEPDWPQTEFIVGNPPFLGGKILRSELGDDYVNDLFTLWKSRVAAESDLCCYWFEKARVMIEAGKTKRAGLLATQGICGGANRKCLERIQQSGNIFFGIADREWFLDGANVHISMVGFDDGSETTRTLDGNPVSAIYPNLGADAMDTTSAGKLAANLGIAFMGVTPAGPFDIPIETAIQWLNEPNPHGRPNSDVLRPYINGKDLNQRSRSQWTVDFTGMSRQAASCFATPFSHVETAVRPARASNNRESYRDNWWLYAEARQGMRSAFRPLARYIATCMVAKHRLFLFLPAEIVPANVVIVFARSDDYFFGVLHSRIHEIWALAQGTQLREKESGFRYTPTTCFETFPMPEPTAAQEAAIAAAARELNELRERWTNPPEWTREEVLEFPAAPDGPWARFVAPGDHTARWPRRVPMDAARAAKLAKRTLTNLYNERPAWLAHAHAALDTALDTAVAAAYGWPAELTDAEILARLLAGNRGGG